MVAKTHQMPLLTSSQANHVGYGWVNVIISLVKIGEFQLTGAHMTGRKLDPILDDFGIKIQINAFIWPIYLFIYWSILSELCTI